MHVRKNDTVILLKDFSGPSPAKKGATARVLKAFPKKNRVILEGINVKFKHLRAGANRDYPRGGIIKKEAAIDASNVALFCPKCGGPCRAEWKLVEGKTARTCRTCGQPIEATT